MVEKIIIPQSVEDLDNLVSDDIVQGRYDIAKKAGESSRLYLYQLLDNKEESYLIQYILTNPLNRINKHVCSRGHISFDEEGLLFDVCNSWISYYTEYNTDEFEEMRELLKSKGLWRNPQ